MWVKSICAFKVRLRLVSTLLAQQFIMEHKVHILQKNRLETVSLFLNVNHGDENNILACHLIVMTLPSLSTLHTLRARYSNVE